MGGGQIPWSARRSRGRSGWRPGPRCQHVRARPRRCRLADARPPRQTSSSTPTRARRSSSSQSSASPIRTVPTRTKSPSLPKRCGRRPTRTRDLASIRTTTTASTDAAARQGVPDGGTNAAPARQTRSGLRVATSPARRQLPNYARLARRTMPVAASRPFESDASATQAARCRSVAIMRETLAAGLEQGSHPILIRFAEQPGLPFQLFRCIR